MTKARRGIDVGRRNQSEARRREPVKIGEVVSSLLARSGYAHVQSSAAIEEIWNEIVGGELAVHSRPGVIRRDVLEVIVRNSAVLHQLSFKKRELISGLRERLVQRTIRDVRFRVGEIN